MALLIGAGRGIGEAIARASVAESAIRHRSRTAVLLCARQGPAIHCSAIHPAAIPHAMPGTGGDRATRMAALVRDTSLQRFGTPEEIAAVAVYRASDASS